MLASVRAPNADSALNLPALRRIGQLSDCRPVVVIDTREQAPLPITRLRAVRATLPTGDYAILGAEIQAVIERKSIDDLVGCCAGSNRERFERELARMEAYRFRRLLVVGSREEIEAGLYFSNINPKAVLSSLSAWEVRYNTPVVFCPRPRPQLARWNPGCFGWPARSS